MGPLDSSAAREKDEIGYRMWALAGCYSSWISQETNAKAEVTGIVTSSLLLEKKQKKKVKGLKIKYKRFSVPEEYKPVYNTNWFFCCTVHFRTMLTLTRLIPWPEAALDSDTWLFRNEHFCLRIIQISCLFRLIWAQFSCCWNLLSSQLPVLWVHNPSPQPIHFCEEPVPPVALRYLKHIQYLQCKHSFCTITLKSSGIPFVHLVANQDFCSETHIWQ